MDSAMMAVSLLNEGQKSTVSLPPLTAGLSHSLIKRSVHVTARHRGVTTECRLELLPTGITGNKTTQLSTLKGQQF